MRIGFGLALLALSVALALPARAGEQGVLSLIVENDVFGNTDRNYTNGLKLSYVSPWGEEDAWTRWVVDTFWGGRDDLHLRSVYGIGHSMFTPDDISVAAPLPGQRPYASYLYLDHGFLVESTKTLSLFDLEVGIVGPSAGGEWVQSKFHNRFDFEEPKGWDNQLKDELVAALTLERQWKNLFTDFPFGLETELRPGYGAAIGNLRTELFGGATLRFGRSLNTGSLPPRIRPSLAGSGFFAPDGGFSWYGFIGVNGRWVGQNIFLDGNSWRDSLSVKKKPFVLDSQAGFAVQLGGVQLTYTYIIRTEEYKGQVANDKFGAIGISMRL